MNTIHNRGLGGNQAFEARIPLILRMEEGTERPQIQKYRLTASIDKNNAFIKRWQQTMKHK